MNRFAQIGALQSIRLFALVPLVLSGGALIGHLTGNPLLPSVRDAYRTMSGATTCGLLALSLSLYACAAGWRRWSFALATLAAVLHGMILGGLLLFDEDRISRQLSAVLFPASSWGFQTSRSVAFSILMLSLSIGLDRRPRLARIADLLSAAALVVAGTALLGYVYGVDDLAAIPFFNNMALATAVALLCLSIAVFCTRAETGWASVVASSYSIGGATRRQLLLLLWAPIVAWIAMAAVNGRRLLPGAAMALVVIATVIPMALLILRDGRRQIALDIAKRNRDAELAAIAADAQRRLAEQSEQLQAESAERAKAEARVYRAQRLEAVGQLTGGIAHDFNNLLMAVSGNVQLLERRLAAGDPAMRFVGNLRNAVAKGTKVTQQLLAFARSQRLNVKPTAIRPVLTSARELIGHSLGPHIRIRLVDESPVELWALCDADQLELSILNLAVNSRDAMPNGGSITIEAASSTLPRGPDGTGAVTDAAVPRPSAGAAGPEAAAGRPCVLIRVIDDGVGMPPEVAAHAAEPFFTTKERGKGTGLGLAQVYGFVMQCGGDFRLTTEPGAGTTVELRFPDADPAPAQAVAPSTPSSAETPPPGDRQRILVIDDDDDVRTVIVQGLTQAGFLVSEAHDGMSGLAALERLAADAAVIDFLMPGLNGAEVARIARERRAGLPIVFVSGYSDTAALESIEGARVLRKPFDLSTLIRTVRAALEAA